MAGYVIGSEKGQRIADDLKVGGTYKASDGSTWTKNADGSVSVTTKNGGYTANAYTSPYSTSSPSATAAKNGSKAGVSNKNKSSVNTNTTASPATSVNTAKKNPNIVNTNTSWKGSYLDVDLNEDYSARINEAKNRGDYAQAANYEALRNAKINWLNSNNQNTGGYSTTSNYLSRTSTNNKGGASYDPTSNYNPNQVGTFYNNGTRYRTDNNGNIYGVSGVQADGTVNEYLVGNGMNPETGEFIFTNPEDAKNAYIQQMSGVGMNPYGLSYDEAEKLGLVDPNYVGSLMNGDVVNYTKYLQDQVPVKKDKSITYIDDKDVPLAEPNDNSFESVPDNNAYWTSRIYNRGRWF